MATVESRKRARTEDGEGVRAKKRVVTEERNSPGVVNVTSNPDASNSNEADEPKDNDDLELFRKDAIYRRMKHYSRENERNLAKIAELERRKHSCEAGVAALEACWAQLVDTIKSLTKPEDMPQSTVQSEDIYDLSAHVSSDSDPSYVESLQGKVQATQQLITAFVQLAGKEQAVLSRDEVYTQCQRAQTQCSSLRSEVNLMRQKLKSSESERERLQEELAAAHTRIDRLQSKTVAALNNTSKSSSNPGGAENGGTGEVKKEEGSPAPSSPSGATPGVAVNGIHEVLENAPGASTEEPDAKPMDVDVEKSADDIAAETEAVADVREQRINELHLETLQLKTQMNDLRASMKAPSTEYVLESTVYKHLLDSARDHIYKEEQRQSELQTLTNQVDVLTRLNQEWKTEFDTRYEKALAEFNDKAEKLNADNNRLRETRNKYEAELNERRQKDAIKFTSTNEWRSLAASRRERIDVLLAEVNRLRTRLAADAGDADLMRFFFQNPPKATKDDEGDQLPVIEGVDQAYVHDLRHKLATAEDRLTALEATLSHLEQNSPDVAVHVRAEAEAKQQISQLQRRLQEYEAILGVHSKDDSTKRLVEEVKRLRLQVKQGEEAESSMNNELEKLMSGWEAQDKQLQNKVFDLAAMEEKVQKAGIERAKADNKYYATMRDKEASDNERKALQRNSEKQAKMIESLVEAEKHAANLAAQAESEMIQLRKAMESCKEAAQKAQDEVKQMQGKLEAETRRAETLRQTCNEYDIQLINKRAQVLKDLETAAKQKVETERLLAKAKEKAEKASIRTDASTREAELQSEVDKCMSLLQCSTCRSNIRSTVITKCLHTFCKPCIDSRISSRQRKCPACNVSFSQGEVQTLYFQ